MKRTHTNLPKFEKDYSFERTLSKGVIGASHLVSKNDKKYVAKMLEPSFLSSRAIENLPNLSKKVLELNNDNIIEHYDFLNTNNEFYFIREFSQIGTLEDVLQFVDQFSESVVSHIAHDISMAIIYLHERNIYSLNIKPSNLIVSIDGKIKLTDFYICNGIFPSNCNIVTDSRYCPYEFMYQTKQSDISVLAILCLQLVMKKHFNKTIKSFSDFIDNITRYDDISTLLEGEDVSEEFIQFIVECLDPNPEKRPDAKELLECKFIKVSEKGEEEYNEFINDVLNFFKDNDVNSINDYCKNDNENISYSFAIQKSHVITPGVTALQLVTTGLDSILDCLDGGQTAKEEQRKVVSISYALNQITSFNMMSYQTPEEENKQLN